MKHPWIQALRMVAAPIRKIIIFTIGSTVVLIGVATIVLPGPASLIIPAGLAILAIEFVWARRLLKQTREMAATAAARMGMGRFFKARQDPSAPASTPDNAPNSGAPSATRDGQNRTPGA